MFDRVFGADEPVGESAGEEAPFHIHIASRLSCADLPGGATTALMAQAVIQLLSVLAYKLECAEGPDARARMRRDLLKAYPQQVSEPDKLHYRKYEDFCSRAVLAGGVTMPHRASLIAARGLSQARLLPCQDDGLSAQRAHKFRELAQQGIRLMACELPASGTEFIQVLEGLDALDLEGKYTARVTQRARLDQEAEVGRAAEKLKKAVMDDLQAAIRREVNGQWMPLVRPTRKRHAGGGALGIIAPVSAAAHATEAALVPSTAPAPLVDAVRDALMATRQGQVVVQKLMESGATYSRDEHPQFHAVLQTIAAANADTTRDNYAQRIRENAACTITALEAHDEAMQAQRAAERAAGEEQQTLDVQARSRAAGPEAWPQAGSIGPVFHTEPAPSIGSVAGLVKRLPMSQVEHLAWPVPPTTAPVMPTRPSTRRVGRQKETERPL